MLYCYNSVLKSSQLATKGKKQKLHEVSSSSGKAKNQQKLCWNKNGACMLCPYAVSHFKISTVIFYLATSIMGKAVVLERSSTVHGVLLASSELRLQIENCFLPFSILSTKYNLWEDPTQHKGHCEEVATTLILKSSLFSSSFMHCLCF